MAIGRYAEVVFQQSTNYNAVHYSILIIYFRIMVAHSPSIMLYSIYYQLILSFNITYVLHFMK